MRHRGGYNPADLIFSFQGSNARGGRTLAPYCLLPWRPVTGRPRRRVTRRGLVLIGAVGTTAIGCVTVGRHLSVWFPRGGLNQCRGAQYLQPHIPVLQHMWENYIVVVQRRSHWVYVTIDIARIMTASFEHQTRRRSSVRVVSWNFWSIINTCVEANSVTAWLFPSLGLTTTPPSTADRNYVKCEPITAAVYTTRRNYIRHTCHCARCSHY